MSANRWQSKGRAPRPAILVAVTAEGYVARETATAAFDTAEAGPLVAERRWRAEYRGMTILPFATIREYRQWRTDLHIKSNPLWPDPDPDAYLLGLAPDASDAPPAVVL